MKLGLDDIDGVALSSLTELQRNLIGGLIQQRIRRVLLRLGEGQDKNSSHTMRERALSSSL